MPWEAREEVVRYLKVETAVEEFEVWRTDDI
jgi:hypothetical protein